MIGDPDYGWTSLQTRVSADLERAGTILPQQLKIVLAGLGTLPGRVLTVAAYDRADGAAGLEARFIEDRIAKAARLHGATEERVRAALLALVDPITGQKTVERPTEELLSVIDPTAPEKARPVLELLPAGAPSTGLRDVLQHGAVFPVGNAVTLAVWAAAAITLAARMFRWD